MTHVQGTYFDALFPQMYETRERSVFGEHWCGPDHFTHCKWVVVAQYPKNGGDGNPVTVECMALPARAYRITAHPSENSLGDALPGFVLSTGSGMGQWTAETALAISQGMVGIHNNEEDASS